MNLFGLTNIPGKRIIRFPLSDIIQREVNLIFNDQHNKFFSDVETIKFDGWYTPDENELLYIEEIENEDIDGIMDAVSSPLSVDQFSPTEYSLANLKAIFTSIQFEGRTRILIQLFERKRLLSTSRLSLFYSGNTFQKLQDSGFSLDNKLLAVLDENKLYFQSFHFLSRVFDLNEYYKEATDAEIIEFANHRCLSVPNINLFLTNANAQIRKKIALIRQSGILDRVPIKDLVSIGLSFNLPLQLNNQDQIIIPNDKKELRRLLRFLNEDYYDSPLSENRYISNSKRVAD